MLNRPRLLTAWNRLEPFIPLLLLGLCCAVFFWDIIFAGKMMMLRDTWCGWFAEKAMQKRAFWSGHLPVLDPFESSGGQIFLGDNPNGAIYPGSLLFMFLPLLPALKLYIIAHLLIAGSGFYLLLRSWGVVRPAALLAAITSAFGGYSVANIEWGFMLSAMAWLPWVLLMAGRIAAGDSERNALRGKSKRWVFDFVPGFPAVALMTLLLSLQYLGGHPEIWWFSTVTLGLFLLIEIPIEHGRLAAFRVWQAVGLAALLAALITSPEWMMLAERVPLSVRATQFDPLMSQGSAHPRHWLTLVLPFLFGRPGYPDRFWGITMFEYWISSSYVGIVPLLCAVAALFGGWRGPGRAARARLIFLTTLLLLGIFLASGQYTPVFPFFHRFVPGFTKMRWPSKTLFFVYYALVMLSGVGANLLLQWRAKRMSAADRAARWPATAWIIPALALAISALLLLAIFATRQTETLSNLFQSLTLHRAEPTADRLRDFHRQLLAGLVIASLTTVLFALLLVRRIPYQVLAGLMCAVTFGDLFYIGRQVHPIGPNDVWDFPQDLADRAMPGASPLSRLMSNYGAVQQFMYAQPDPATWQAAKPLAVGDSWLMFNVNNTWASALVVERYAQLLSLTGLNDDAAANRVADLMSVTHLIGWRPRPEPWQGQPLNIAQAWHRPTALPRALLLRNWIKPTDWQFGARFLLSPELDISYSGTLEPDESGNAPPLPDRAQAPRRCNVRDIRYGWDRCNIDLETDGQALLLLNDIFYPGWRAEVDGVPANIYRANLTFRGVLVGAGAKHVTFHYEPAPLRIGRILSLTTIAGMLIALGVVWFQGRRRIRVVSAPQTSA